ncbi:MAG: hypothetical protein NC429_00905 [Lachnospiraceae bacterium]|nr:hypothetical protein [Lachnospiraceae bacterium]
MSKRQKEIFLLTALTLFFLVILITGIVYLNYAAPRVKGTEEPDAEAGDELAVLLSDAGAAIRNTAPEEPEAFRQASEESESQSDAHTNKEAVPDGKKADALTDQKVRLKDVYSVKGEDIFFRCFDPEAEAYAWEYYDTSAEKWVTAPDSSVSLRPDELGRTVSMFQLQKNEADNETMARCTLKFNGKEAEVQTASLYLIDNIEKIAVKDLETDANRYLGADELPVTVFYKDGREEELTGLAGMYFVATEENTDYDLTVSGNRIETTTIVRTECEYYNTGTDSREVLVRCRTAGQEAVETICRITGKDTKPPEIKEVTTSPFEVSGIDQPVDMTITITAEDETTPYPELEYAFLYSDQEPAEADWQKNPSFDASIERNGTYLAYARDQSGNVGKLEKEIITVDTKAPVISEVTLSEEAWCQCLTILVTARDAGEISYSYENRTAGINSGWLTYNEYTIDTNGSWIIKARDAAGNTAETEITISNIDKEAPVIQRISAK